MACMLSDSLGHSGRQIKGGFALAKQAVTNDYIDALDADSNVRRSTFSPTSAPLALDGWAIAGTHSVQQPLPSLTILQPCPDCVTSLVRASASATGGTIRARADDVSPVAWLRQRQRREMLS